MSQAAAVLIGTIVGALVTGGFALLRDSGTAQREKGRMRFEQSERRHDDRKSAYTEFDAVMRSRVRAVREFIDEVGEHPVSTYGYILPTEAAELALSTLCLFAPDDTSAAATRYASAVSDYENRRADSTAVAESGDAWVPLARRDLHGMGAA